MLLCNIEGCMKRGLFFVLGVLVGILLTFGFLFVSSKINSSVKSLPGLTSLDNPGKTLKGDWIDVFQVVNSYCALSWLDEDGEDLTVLYMKDPNDPTILYDDLVIDVPKGKCLKVVGTYRYETRREGWKTVPVVAMYDKE